MGLTPSEAQHMKYLGNYVRRLRLQRNLSVRRLALLAKMDASAVSRIEHGIYGVPGARLMRQLATALDVSVADFHAAAGYDEGDRLPSYDAYLHAKYDLPGEAIEQLKAYFEFISDKYQSKEQGNVYHDTNTYHRRSP
jgi:transcriptional regulator with XRE-family HTH domain